MEIEYLNSILYLQYNTIDEEAHSHPVCEGFLFLQTFNRFHYLKFCLYLAFIYTCLRIQGYRTKSVLNYVIRNQQVINEWDRK